MAAEVGPLFTRFWAIIALQHRPYAPTSAPTTRLLVPADPVDHTTRPVPAERLYLPIQMNDRQVADSLRRCLVVFHVRVRAVVLLVLVSLLAGSLPMGPGADVIFIEPAAAQDGDGHDHAHAHTHPDHPPPCRVQRHVEGIGPVCDDADLPPGLFAVRHADGSIGYTHGLDAEPPAPATNDVGASAIVAPERDPFCVDDASTDYHTVAVYVVPTDRTDNYASKAGDIRTYIKRANGLLFSDADLRGAEADYRVACTGGTIDVLNIPLTTTHLATDFNTIVNDIKNASHNDGREKYWIWADVSSFGCSGVGHVYLDDSADVNNLNNGAASSGMFAVTFGPTCSADNNVLVMMHENGHNMGAVQTTAPNSSGWNGGSGGHCNDGLDIMCYADGGPNSNYDSSVCTLRHFYDCNHNDYFDPSPSAGSYLSTHWNIGDLRNRFLDLLLVNSPPDMLELSCPPGDAYQNESISCSFRASDPDGHNIAYLIDWGDGSAVQRNPGTGFVASGTLRGSTHTYTTTGSWTLSVSAVDDHASNPKESNPLTLTFNVLAANAKPVFTQTISCTPAQASDAEPSSCSWAADDSDAAGVYYEVAWDDGSPIERVPASGFATPGALQTVSHDWQTSGLLTVVVTVFDDASPPRTATSGRVIDVLHGVDPCTLSAMGTMAVGVPRLAVASEDVNRDRIFGLEEGCWGKQFRLREKGGIAPGFEVCWNDAVGARISCNLGSGSGVSGTIPQGTASADVIFIQGVNGSYHLFYV